ncbi:type III-B CRISPR-associated protein Cas10/Cmr2 [Pseudothermotoga thermarum]|uniref:CRISPR-associated protein, Crm2 family n=1 Tax=Pseudothermotoga thermarum DSM 5069 TaxID=688269 RepID=F7YTM1_9THEM|nr:type III-B CRISPR-associated protein Cas10/Cmr2 [Pseudothermotoga thermarum]AEH51243.1 CRISPR-associated protein, Crm2 family [Pseudothermotoga thermarum DSM 5069]
MKNCERILKGFLHDPIDKVLRIPGHVGRAKMCMEILGISGFEEAKDSDMIAAAMERTLLEDTEKIQPFTEIRHPLCEGKLDVPEGFPEGIPEILEDVLKKIKYLQPEEMVYWLYRNYIDEVVAKLKVKGDVELSKYMPILPADTRVPDHSIFEHLKIASAINSYEKYQDNSLFFFSIGPVQSFISQSRKTQDLYNSSYLLSYLTFVATWVVAEEYGPMSIIYPELYGQPLFDWFLEKKKQIEVKNSLSSLVDLATIPNKFVAILPTSKQEELEDIVKKCEKEVREKWNDIVEYVLDNFLTSKPQQEIIDRQIKDFPEIYWVIVPWRINGKEVQIEAFRELKIETETIEKIIKTLKKQSLPVNVGIYYPLIYSLGEKFLKARKQLRNFVQTEEYGKKCTICGEREGVVSQGNVKPDKKHILKDKECLCVNCFAKRMLDEYLEKKEFPGATFGGFPSTAEICLADFREKILSSEDCRTAYEEFSKEFSKLLSVRIVKDSVVPKLKDDFDKIAENIYGEWLFEENLTQRKIKEELGEVERIEKNLPELRERLKELHKKVGKPSPYYAVIMLDGDNMGKWLSGELLPDIRYSYNTEVYESFSDSFKNNLPERKLLTPAIHASISHALRNYAIEFVKPIVEKEHLGKLVYAGGDDVLAFVNLKDLIPVLRKLRAAFSGQVEIVDGRIQVKSDNKTGFVEKDDKLILTMGPNATASCGVVIAHYKEPLKYVLNKVREMEEKAKQNDRNSFAINLIRRGKERIIVSKWFVEDNKTDVLSELENILRYFKEEKLSKTFVSKVYDSVVKTVNSTNGQLRLRGKMLEYELKRLIKRSSDPNKITNEEIESLAEKLHKLTYASFHYNFGSFICFIYLAAFLSDYLL